MGYAVDLRMKPLHARILVLQIDSESTGAEHNLSVE